MHTSTMTGSGGGIFTANETNKRRLIGVSSEYESNTISYGTSLAQLVDCFTTDGVFTLKPESCLRDLKLSLYNRRNYQLEGFKYLTRNMTETSTNASLLLSTDANNMTLLNIDKMFIKLDNVTDSMNLRTDGMTSGGLTQIISIMAILPMILLF